MWKEERKKRGRGGRDEERAGRQEEGFTSRFSESVFFSAQNTKYSAERASCIVIYFPCGGWPNPWVQDAWLHSGLCPLQRPTCVLWVRSGLEISLAVWLDQSFNCIDFPLVLLCCDLLSHSDSYLTVVESEWLYYYAVLISSYQDSFCFMSSPYLCQKPAYCILKKRNPYRILYLWLWVVAERGTSSKQVTKVTKSIENHHKAPTHGCPCVLLSAKVTGVLQKGWDSAEHFNAAYLTHPQLPGLCSLLFLKMCMQMHH